MQWPLLAGRESLVQTLDVFGGYHHKARIGDGEFYDMINMTSDHYPVLAPRNPRGIYRKDCHVQGMIAKDALCYVDGSCFVINGEALDLGLSAKPEDCPKQLVSMGAYVIILPDKQYVNTANPSDRGNLEAVFTTNAPVTFSLTTAEGAAYDPAYCQPGQPESPENMAYWLDTSGRPHSLKQWSASSGMWVTVASTYVKIASAGIGKSFEAYDGVFLRGLTGTLTDSISGEILADTTELAALQGTAVIHARGDDFIVIPGMLEMTRTILEPITVSREMPLMDFVIERENRLWGCRYGLDRDGRVVNEIYASKLGDFKNWNCFMGISTDSYVVSLGSDGPFTGAVTYGGNPLFWKENCVHKVFGSYPANFGIQTTACRGVRQGSGRSLAIVNELLYYQSRHAVCRYDGALPVEISEALGETPYGSAVAAAHGNKYYISLERENGDGADLLVYDTAKGLWHKEEDPGVYLLCACGDALYCATKAGDILTLLGSGETLEKSVSWMVQTGPIGISLPEAKVLKKLHIRMALAVGAWAAIRVQYDSVGEWKTLGTVTGTGLRSFRFSIRPRRCDHFKLRIQGQGQARIYSFTKSITQGSDRP